MLDFVTMMANKDKEIAELRAENARLKKQALDWKKWPEEKDKAIDGVDYIIKYLGMYQIAKYPSGWMSLTFEFAEIPEPEETK